MTYELGVMTSIGGCALAFDDGNEESSQFVTLLAKRLQLQRLNRAGVHEQLEPVRGFLEFSKAVAHLGDELRVGTAAESLSVIGTDRRRGTQHLVTEHAPDRATR